MGLFEIQKSYNRNTKESVQVTKVLDLKTIDSAVRPMTDEVIYNNRAINRWNVSRFGLNLINLFDLWGLARYADILQTILNTRGRETFRNGFNIKGKHEGASVGQRETIDRFMKKANKNGQTMTEVLKEFLKDIDWADDGYLLVSKNYHLNEDKVIIGAQVEEVIRLNPLTVELVLDRSRRLGYFEDSNDSLDGSKLAYFDLKTRQLTFDTIDKDTGLQNLQAHYKVRTTDGVRYYNNTEIIHKSLHNPSLTYGFSPLFSLYPKVLILITQDDFVRKYYGDNKPPKGFLIFNTDNAQGLAKVMDDIRQKSKQNPHEIFPIPFQTKDGRDPVTFVDMTRSLDEMQFTETRNEFRNQIGAPYGVSPVFQNDISTSGGLNNEGLQITITNRAVEDIQTMFNQSVLPFIFEQNIGITDWIIELNPSEEEDEAFKLDLETKELANIKTRLEMGQSISQDATGKFIIEEGELKLEQTSSEFIPFGASADDTVVDVHTPIQVGKQEIFNTSEDEGHLHEWVTGAELTSVVDDHQHKINESKGIAEPAGVNNHTHKLLKNTTKKKKKKDKYKSVAKKENPIPVREQRKFETTLEKELNGILKELDLKKKPTEKQLKKTVDKLTKNMDKQLKAKSANRVKAVYSKTLNKVNRELGEKFTISDKDKNVIEALKRNPTFTGAFASTSKALSKNLKEVITKAYDNPETFTIDNLVKSMKEQSQIANNSLRTIARTESSKISLAARKVSYQKSGDFDAMKFIVLGPSDARTGKDSKKIVKQVGKGKSWDEIVNIIQKNAGKGWTVDKDAPIPRPNWRHSIVKVVD